MSSDRGAVAWPRLNGRPPSKQALAALLVAAIMVTLVRLLSHELTQAQTVVQPSRGVTDPGVVTTRQAITPPGVQSVFDGACMASRSVVMATNGGC